MDHKMQLDDACFLADFINSNDGGYLAKVLRFGSEAECGWVIVLDEGTGKYLEPIANAPDYLRRAGLGVLQIDAAYHEMIRQWMTKN